MNPFENMDDPEKWIKEGRTELPAEAQAAIKVMGAMKVALVEAGFTEDQAMRVVLLTMATGGAR